MALSARASPIAFDRIQMPTASILFNSDFLEAAFTRYRRQHRLRLLIAGVKIVGAVVFGAAATILFWAGKPFEALLAVLFVASSAKSVGETGI